MKKIFHIEIPWKKIIILMVILVNIKRVFTDLGVDFEYAIAQSYRMAMGDHMMVQMWEPHQTSAFLCAFFIKIYMMLTGTTTGIGLYLNIVGLGVKSCVAYLFYRTFQRYCDKNILFLMSAFFMTASAKGLILLEFSNMMVYFSILVCCSLFTYFQKQELDAQKKIWLILGAGCFCLEVLSYPSTIILYPFLLAVLCRYSVTKKKDMALFSCVCSILGVAFLIFLISQTGLEQFLVSAKYIITGDSSHGVGRLAEQIKIYITDLGSIVILFCMCAMIAFFIGKGLKHKKIVISGFGYLEIFMVVLLSCIFVVILFDVSVSSLPLTFRSLYGTAYVPFMFLAYRMKKYCSREEQMASYIGIGLSIGSGLAVLLLTNLTLLMTIPYLILGVMVSMMSVGEYLNAVMPEKKVFRRYGMLILFLLMIMFRSIYVYFPSGNVHATILSVRQVVKDGPMMGLFTDYIGGYIRNANLDDWKQYVSEGDKILIVGDTVSAIGYLYENTEVCVDSTICTPTYDEKLLAYWELNPQKEPNVVILDCWYGEPKISEDTWIMGWIKENFESYVDGKYVRIYRRELP